MRRFWLRLIAAPILVLVLSLYGQVASVTMREQTTFAQKGFVQTAVAQASREVVVAAAANFSEAFRAMGPKFEAATGIYPVFSFGSTAQLANQVERGAPFDVYAAADGDHPQKLEREGLRQSRAVFARGVLALWLRSAVSGNWDGETGTGSVWGRGAGIREISGKWQRSGSTEGIWVPGCDFKAAYRFETVGWAVSLVRRMGDVCMVVQFGTGAL